MHANGQTHKEDSIAGAVEPNAQGCAFAHPIFHPQARKGQVLRTKILISIK